MSIYEGQFVMYLSITSTSTSSHKGKIVIYLHIHSQFKRETVLRVCFLFLKVLSG